MTIDAAVLIGEGPDSLEGTKVTTPAGADLFREGVVISDPEIPGARAEVRQMGAQLTEADWGLVTHSVIQGFSTAQGGEYHDVKVTPSGALTVEAAVTGTVSLSAGTLAALETINVGNFPATQVVSDGGGSLTVDGSVNASVTGTVALDTATLSALETINVGNTVAVSATDLDIRNLSSAQDSVTVTGSVNAAVSGTVEITNDAGNPIPISGTVAVTDGGGSLTVDGSVSVNNTVTVSATDLDIRNLSSAQDSVSVTGTVAVNNHPASQSVVGSGAAATAQRVQLADESLAALENISATVSATDLDIRNLSSAQDSVSITDGGGSITVDGSVSVSGTVALDSTTLAALETISVANFPATQAVSGTVTVTQATAANLNATVSGTVTANLGTLNGAATAANQTTTNSTLASLDAKTPDESGAWGYNAGTAGTLSVAANKRILAITATAGALLGATMTINGGQTITIPAGTSITIAPRANLTAPTLVFTSTASYFVEFIE